MDILSSPSPLQLMKQNKTSPAQNANAQKMHAVAKDFESVVLATMLAPMFNGETTQNTLSGSHAESTYKGLLVEEYAKEISRNGGIGVAEQIYRDMMSSQEMKP